MEKELNEVKGYWKQNKKTIVTTVLITFVVLFVLRFLDFFFVGAIIAAVVVGVVLFGGKLLEKHGGLDGIWKSLKKELSEKEISE